MAVSSGVQVEPEREIPIIRNVDVLVAGGGPAGIAAAIAAAREGAETLLVERFGYLGGMITGSYVIWILGMGDGYRPVMRGICEDIRNRLEPLDGVRDPNRCGDYVVDPEVFKWQAVEMLEEAGVELLLHTVVCDPIVEDDVVEGVFIESKSGRQAIRAKVVIDCTADADVAYRAGCGCENETHDVSLTMKVDGIDRGKVKKFEDNNPERYQEIIEAARKLNGGSLPNQGRHIKGIDITEAEDLTRCEIETRRGAFNSLYYLRENLPGWEKAMIKETAPQLGVRQGRRIHGEYTLTNDELTSSKHFDDTIARLGACLLVYKLYDPEKLDYDIPYGCLVPKDMNGLLVAGRTISSDYLAENSLRLIVPCFASGQAAGAAAALAVRDDVEPRDVNIKSLQDALRKQNVNLGDNYPEAPKGCDDDSPVEVWDS